MMIYLNQQQEVIIMTQTHSTSQSSFNEALCALRRGKAVIFPTDTLFGLGVSIQHAFSPDILYSIKLREKRKPIAWLVSGIDALDTYGKDVPSYVDALIDAFWPGALTVIVKANDKVPATFRSDRGSIGMRMPANTCALDLISALGYPIATTSANISGEENVCLFDDLDSRVLSYVDAAINDNEKKSGIASTIIDCTSENGPVLLREGVITAADIQKVL